MRIKMTPRLILAAALIAVAGIILLVSRFTGGQPSDTTRAHTVAPATTSSAEPVTPPPPSSDDGENDQAPATTRPAARPTIPATTGAAPAGHDDDGGDPILVDPTYQPDVREAAAAFTAAWLNTYGKTAAVWRAALTPRVTPDMAEDLGYADPESVPTGAKVGTPIAVSAEGSLFNATVPVAAVGPQPKTLGELNLTIIRSGGKWLVSEIDWKAAGR